MTTGFCFQKDTVRDIQMRLVEFNWIVIGSPVYYSAPTGQLISFLNRLFFATEKRMAGKLGASVVSCRRGGASETFEQLNQYFTICNMPIVSSQYWNSVHGFTPDDVNQDKEGLQTMRVLGQNMAWLLKCIESGKKAGIEKPISFNKRWKFIIRSCSFLTFIGIYAIISASFSTVSCGLGNNDIVLTFSECQIIHNFGLWQKTI